MKALPMHNHKVPGYNVGCDECVPSVEGGVPANPFSTVFPPKQAFNVAADGAFGEAQAIHGQRGDEYSDSWALENVHAPILRMSLREIFGFDASEEELRIIMAASLCDVKDSRYVGGWKKDTALDGLNYRAAHCSWLSAYLEQHSNG